MALTAVVTQDPALPEVLRGALDPTWHDVMVCPAWASVRRAVRERPVGTLVLDLRCLARDREVAALQGFWSRYPSVPTAVLAPSGDPLRLFDLGRAGLRHLAIFEETGPLGMARLLRELEQEAAPALVARAMAPFVARDLMAILRGAMESTHRRWDADEFAERFGMCRPRLSRRLREGGLPSVGHLLGWARMLHAAHWLPDPGRSGESVGRQLEFANGSTFRRALRNTLMATPTEIADGGGLGMAIAALCRTSGFPAIVPRSRWVA